MRRIYETGVVAPALAGLGGGLGVWVTRENVEFAPGAVFASLAVAVVAVALRSRGVALAALGVGAASAFASPTGLGPLLVATGVIVAAEPAAVDRRIARWPDLVDAVIAVPAMAGLASVIAAQPSARGVALGVGAGVCAALSWWRGPSHGAHEPQRETMIAYLGAAGGLMVAFAPDLFRVLGVLPDATITAGRGLTAAAGVFTLALVVQQMRRMRAKATSRDALRISRRPRPEVSKPTQSS